MNLLFLEAQFIKFYINDFGEEMLKNTWREIEYRLDILRATNKAHVKSINSMKKQILETWLLLKLLQIF